MVTVPIDIFIKKQSQPKKSAILNFKNSAVLKITTFYFFLPLIILQLTNNAHSHDSSYLQSTNIMCKIKNNDTITL